MNQTNTKICGKKRKARCNEEDDGLDEPPIKKPKVIYEDNKGI